MLPYFIEKSQNHRPRRYSMDTVSTASSSGHSSKSTASTKTVANRLKSVCFIDATNNKNKMAAINAKAVAYCKKNKFEKAIQLLIQAFKDQKRSLTTKSPRDLGYHPIPSYIHPLVNEDDEARLHMKTESIEEEDPENTVAAILLFNLAQVKLLSGNYKAALELYQHSYLMDCHQRSSRVHGYILCNVGVILYSSIGADTPVLLRRCFGRRAAQKLTASSESVQEAIIQYAQKISSRDDKDNQNNRKNKRPSKVFLVIANKTYQNAGLT